MFDKKQWMFLYFLCKYYLRSQDSVISMVTSYGLDDGLEFWLGQEFL